MVLRDVGCGNMDWIGLAQDRSRWWTLVHAVTFEFYKMLGMFSLAENLLASQEGLCSMELVMNS